jgi:hypothetical protein
VVQPTVTEDGNKAPSLRFGQPRVMALLLALTLFQHLIDGFHNRDLRGLVADLLGVTTEQYTASQMTYDLRRLRLKGMIVRPPKTNRYFVTPTAGKSPGCSPDWKPVCSALRCRCSPPTMRFSPFHCDKLWIASTDNSTSSSMTPSPFQRQAKT